jgi:hypothetical protein
LILVEDTPAPRPFRDRRHLNAACKVLVEAVGLETTWTLDGPTEDARKLQQFLEELSAKGKSLEGDGENESCRVARTLAFDIYREHRFELEHRSRLPASALALFDSLRVASYGEAEDIDRWLASTQAAIEERQRRQEAIAEERRCFHCEVNPAAPRMSGIVFTGSVCWGCARDIKFGYYRTNVRAIQLWFDTNRQRVKATTLEWDFKRIKRDIEFVDAVWEEFVPRHPAEFATIVAKAEGFFSSFWRTVHEREAHETSKESRRRPSVGDGAAIAPSAAPSHWRLTALMVAIAAVVGIAYVLIR